MPTPIIMKLSEYMGSGSGFMPLSFDLSCAKIQIIVRKDVFMPVWYSPGGSTL